MITKTFAFHEPTLLGHEQITAVREEFSEIHEFLTEVCPNSREKSLALTKLEEAAMWAIKAIVSNDPNTKAHTKD